MSKLFSLVSLLSLFSFITQFQSVANTYELLGDEAKEVFENLDAPVKIEKINSQKIITKKLDDIVCYKMISKKDVNYFCHQQ